MSMKEKLIQIAENEQKVYEAGQKSMIDESKIIEKTISGSVITLDDVSEVPHDITINVTEDCNVAIYGRNYFTVSELLSISSNNTFKILSDSSVSIAPDVNGKLYGIYALASFDVGTVIECSVKSISANGSTWGWRLQYDDGTYSSVYGALTKTITINKKTQKILLYADMASMVFTEPIVFTGFRVNIIDGNEFSVSTNNGITKVKSASPYMTISTDTTDVNITATYHKSWGMQTEYDRFWDNFQHYNDVMDAYYAFSGPAWNDNTYNPKGTIIKATKFTNMFRNANITNTKVTLDLTEGVGTYLFHTAEKLTTIPKIIVNENIQFTGWLVYCRKLVTILFEGIIASSLDIHWSINLSYESVESIFNCLGGTASATLTLPTSHNDGRYDNLIANMPSNWAVAWL